ncbi:RING finger domain-containing protein [Francisella sp. SYW-9]|uniref:RING finger domain-containing protein n=1 Tax=Francisella sp. SYW-9 TaxID=2610888 RepID=UPI00123D3049
MQCTICLKNIELDEMTITLCNHTFHHECMTTWLRIYRNKNCPNCQKTISKFKVVKGERIFEVEEVFTKVEISGINISRNINNKIIRKNLIKYIKNLKQKLIIPCNKAFK